MNSLRANVFRRALAGAAVAVALGVAGAVPAQAAQPVLLDSCAVTVQGEPGQLISLKPAAVTPQILSVLAPLDPLKVLRPAFTGIWNTMPPITVGSVGATDGLISGSAIADAVLAKLRGISVLAPVIDVLAPQLKALLGSNCGIETKPGSPAPAPAPAPGQPPAAPGQPAPAPGVTPAPGGSAGGIQQGQGVPGGALSAEYPAGPGQGGVPGPGIPPDGVAYNYGPSAVPQIPDIAATTRGLGGQSTGSAEALPAASTGGIGRPVLLAVLLITLVGTQLVRRWVLRRARNS